VRLDVEQPKFKYGKEPDRPCADDQCVGFDCVRHADYRFAVACRLRVGSIVVNIAV
jgi:hypothetical protein